jgi:hypothetical protein
MECDYIKVSVMALFCEYFNFPRDGIETLSIVTGLLDREHTFIRSSYDYQHNER